VSRGPPIGIIALATKLESLNVLWCNRFLTYLRPEATSVKSLTSLSTLVSDLDSLNALQAIVKSCRNTLESLGIFWKASTLNRPDLSYLILDSPKLKSFGLRWISDSNFYFSSFGDKLETLELLGRISSQVNTTDHIIGAALSKTNKLKRLGFLHCHSISEYVPMIVKANSSTLEELHFSDRDVSPLISNLRFTGSVLLNIKVLSLNGYMFTIETLLMIPDIFPQVEYLKLVIPAREKVRKYDLLDIFEALHSLKGIDLNTRDRDKKLIPRDPLKHFPFPYRRCEFEKELVFFNN
jgi:hypothetical protein